MKPGRNDPCICGSGKKYKHCCQNKNLTTPSPAQSPAQPGTALGSPSSAEQHQLISLYQAGRHADLEIQARLTLKRHPAWETGWKLLCASLMAQGKDALETLREASKRLPDDTSILSFLGNALASQDKTDEAIACFQNVLRLAPNYADGYYNLGQVLAKVRRDADAEKCYRKAIELKPNDADLYNNLGVTLRNQLRHNEAEAAFKKALSLNPDLVEANSCIGSELLAQGKMVEAEIFFRRALACNPNNLLARFALVQSKKIKPDDEDLQTLARVNEELESGEISLSQDDLLRLHFGLGKCYDDTKEYDKAFAHFDTGCKLKRASFTYDVESDISALEEIANIFDRERIAALRGSGNPSCKPIFVVGMPRSGTTLTEQIIASHPLVHGAGELSDLLSIAQQPIGKANFPKNLRLLDQEHLTSWGNLYISALERHSPQAAHITDKMPANFMAVGLIHLMLPNAKIVHVKRNPADCSLSSFTKLFSEEIKYSYNLAELGEFYAGYARLMEHWRTILPEDAFLEVQYEDIVQDAETQARRLIDFCGLEWDPACLDFHKNKREIRTASIVQVRQPIYGSSKERWRHYEKHLGPLLQKLGDLMPKP